ncbi:hypothetical protein EON77_20665, partial [bacterium]
MSDSLEFVDGAIHKLVSAVSRRDVVIADGPDRATRSLSRALAEILAHFDRPSDEMALAASARGDDVEAWIRRV